MLAYKWQFHWRGCFHALGPATFDRPVSREEAEAYWEEWMGRPLDPECEGVSVPTGERVFDECL